MHGRGKSKSARQLLSLFFWLTVRPGLRADGRLPVASTVSFCGAGHTIWFQVDDGRLQVALTLAPLRHLQ